MNQETETITGCVTTAGGGVWSACIQTDTLELAIGIFASKQEAIAAVTEKITGFIELCKFRKSKGVLQ